jgi:hypothetical protein
VLLHLELEDLPLNEEVNMHRIIVRLLAGIPLARENGLVRARADQREIVKVRQSAEHLDQLVPDLLATVPTFRRVELDEVHHLHVLKQPRRQRIRCGHSALGHFLCVQLFVARARFQIDYFRNDRFTIKKVCPFHFVDPTTGPTVLLFSQFVSIS